MNAPDGEKSCLFAIPAGAAKERREECLIVVKNFAGYKKRNNKEENEKKFIKTVSNGDGNCT